MQIFMITITINVAWKRTLTILMSLMTVKKKKSNLKVIGFNLQEILGENML